MGQHRKVKLTRAHLEEDVGKLTHSQRYSLVDYNRAGAPLLEIVSEPDLFNSTEVVAYLNSLRYTLTYAGISDCDMEKGQMRCDANVSVRPKGSSTLGTRTEMKNLNSVSGTKAAIDYEIQRQINELQQGRSIPQETRRWNAESGITESLRSKEEAHDYRYFPDPDLMPVRIEQKTLETLRSELPELPFDKQRRYIQQYELPYTLTSVLCPDHDLATFFETAVALNHKPEAIAKLIANDLLRELSGTEGEGALPLHQSKVTPQHIAELIALIDAGTLSKQIAKEIFPEMFKTGETPMAIVERKGLKQSTDLEEIQTICESVIAENPKPVEEFKAGKEPAINRLKGLVMKASRGKANPLSVDELLRKLMS